MEKTFEYEFNGYKATVIQPNNPNGKWVWKTEFLYAFDNAEIELLNRGYTRVYYQISNMYGNSKSILLMHDFYVDVIERFNLDRRCNLFGFSRGGLYAFNFALYYPECVNSIYLDAPVLDLTDWPKAIDVEYSGMKESYNLTDQTLKTYSDFPIHNLETFFKRNIPIIIVAGDNDKTVTFERNSKVVIDYCEKNNINLKYYVKKGCGHHPHSLEDVTPIVDFVSKVNKTKRLVAIGDSITHGASKDAPCMLVENNFIKIFGKRFGFDEVLNYGTNGITISTATDWRPTLAMSMYIDEMQAGDVGIIAGGTNDWGRNVEIGKADDISTDTFYGALNTLFEKAKKRYKQIIVITPIRRKNCGRNEKGYTLSDYRKAIKLKAEEFSFFVVDGDEIELEFSEHIPDGTHPNSKGHRIYAEHLINKVINAKLTV